VSHALECVAHLLVTNTSSAPPTSSPVNVGALSFLPSERQVNDLRRLIANDVEDDYFGGMRPFRTNGKRKIGLDTALERARKRRN